MMRKRGIIGITAAILLFSGCTNNSNESVDNIIVPDTGSQEQNNQENKKDNNEKVNDEVINDDEKTSGPVCRVNTGIFSVVPNTGSFSNQSLVSVRDIKKKNSNNRYNLFEYTNSSLDNFLDRYKEQTDFPGNAQIEVMTHITNDGIERTLLDIGLENQIRYTTIQDQLIVVEDRLIAKGCEGNNCIQTTEFLELLSCNRE